MHQGVIVRTGQRELDELGPRVGAFLEQDVLDVTIDGEPIRGYRSPDARSIWIRDHSDMMRGFKYFEPDLKTAVSHFAATQADNGRVFDYFTTFPEKLPSERENWTKYVRVPVEADVEYRFVKAAYLAWQASGDDAWIQGLLPKLERALLYSRSHPWRWHEDLGLVKRAYTIDTWDFAYTAGSHDWLQFQIDENTFWGISHADNSGCYEAYRLLATLYSRFGDDARAEAWNGRAEHLRAALNRTCWNGRFYTHFVKLNPVEIPGVDESQQLSLSTPMAVNRGAATHEMAVSILEEYARRGRESGAFAPWFSIDPPFPDGVFGDDLLTAGAYVNGGILPLVGGELARAAFEHGAERMGVETLRRYHALVSERDETYLWYFPDGRPAAVETSTSPEAQPTDGWGSSAMLYAFVEGLAGIEDQGRCFDRIRLAPRWAAADLDEADVEVGYAASGARVGYHYEARGGSVKLELDTPTSDVSCHLLLPEGARAERVRCGSQTVEHRETSVEQSRYVDFDATPGASIEIDLGVARAD